PDREHPEREGPPANSPDHHPDRRQNTRVRREVSGAAALTATHLDIQIHFTTVGYVQALIRLPTEKQSRVAELLDPYLRAGGLPRGTLARIAREAGVTPAYVRIILARLEAA